MNKETYIEKLKELYGDNSFDFSSISYEHDRKPVIITCLIHNHTFNKTRKNNHTY